MSKKNEEYIPKDNSGTDYAAQVGMSAEDRSALDAAGAAWNTYHELGDTLGMEAAHKEAERIRAKYNYSGGADGSEYIQISQDIRKENGGKGSSGGGGGFSYSKAPSYASKYQSQIDSLASQILNRPAFSYDPESDPTYQQYKKSYTREGQRAMTDTLGQVSARTGGLASSYAQSASQQTYDNYMSALADKIPQLKQLAYEMYLDEGDALRANLNLLQGLDSTDYGRYADQLSQYNADRNFDYGVYQDDRNYNYQLGRDAIADSRYDQEWNYQVGRDQIADQRYDQQWQYQQDRDAIADQRYQTEWDYNVYRDLLADQRYDDQWQYQKEQDKQAYQQWLDEFNYGKEQDAISYDQWLKAFEYGKEQDALAFQQWLEELNYGKAQDAESNAQWWAAFNYGKEQDALANSRYDDETAYNRGIYADELTYQRALDKAELLAVAGDFSGYKALGYTDQDIATLRGAYEQELARQLSSGKSSGKSGSTSGTGIIDTMLGFNNDTKAYEYLISLGLSKDERTQLMDYYEDAAYKKALASNPMTKLDYDPDEGIFTWYGDKFNSLDSLEQEINKWDPSEEVLDVLVQKLARYGFKDFAIG